jgi:hypothetical protein
MRCGIENSTRNGLYHAAREYLPSKISHANKNLRAGKSVNRQDIEVGIQVGEAVEDVFDNIKLTWRFFVREDAWF